MSLAETEQLRVLSLVEEAGAMWWEEAAICAELIAASAGSEEDADFFCDRALTFRARAARMRTVAEWAREQVREAILALPGGDGVEVEDLARYARALSRTAAAAARSGSILAAEDPLTAAVAPEAREAAAAAIRFLEAEAAAVSSLVEEAPW